MWQRRRIAAYGMCRDERGRILLVRASADTADPGHWALPGGGVQHGEPPGAALTREFVEETGYGIEVVGLRGVLSDLAIRRDRRGVTHTDRVLYDVRITDGELRSEALGTSDLAAWIAPAELAGLRLLPYASRVLQLPVAPGEPIPPAEPYREHRIVRHQRFAAYGLVTDPTGRMILLTRIADGYPGAGSWHMPGGGTDFGETAEAGLLRELVEETGQHGRITGLLGISDYHNPRARGPEGLPMDWHTVRALFRVIVDVPGRPDVVEARGGSTAEAAWFNRSELGKLHLNEFANGVLLRYPADTWVR
jgi:ADP-ribose pyrophosphatase YjhB (NUDIX family)